MPQLQLLAAPPAHSEPAWSVAFNPKRNILASCSTDKTVRFYSYSLPSDEHGHQHGPGCSHSHSQFPSPTSSKPTINHAQTLSTEHKRTIRSLAWAPSGKTLATGSFDSTVAVWEEVDGEDSEEEDEGGQEGVYRPKKEEVKEEEGEDVDMEPEGKEMKEWECVTTLEGHESECKAVSWSPDGGLLASCSRDKSVWVWEVQPDSDFECIAVMMEHSQDVKTLVWHPHEEILASASYDSHIHLQWDDPDGDWCIFQKLHPKLPLSALSIPRPGAASIPAQNDESPSAGSSASATASPGQVASFNALASALMPTPEEKAAEEHLNVPPLLEDETVWSLAWSPCGRYLASGGDLGGIRIWWRSGTNPDSPLVEILHTTAHSRSCFTLSWSPGGLSADNGGLGILASGGADGKLIIWQITSDQTASTDREKTKEKPSVKAIPIAAVRDAHGVSDINCVTWLQRSDGRGIGILGSCADDGSVKVWRIVADE